MSFAAVDVGGTKIVGALFGDDGASARIELPTPVVDGRADPGGVATQQVAAALVDAASGGLRGVGVGVCEYVDSGRIDSREVLGWPAGQDWLERSFGDVPVVVESDVRCGALAEVGHGGLRGAASGYYVSWGTGLSGCLVVGGRLIEGSHGRAIALGELVVGGARLEDVASGTAMAHRYRREAGTAVAGAREVMGLAAGGDGLAGEIVRSAGVALAEALASVIRLLDPGLVVLGGGLGCAETPAFSAMSVRLGELMGAGLPETGVVHSALGPDGPLIGAAVVAGWRGSGGALDVGGVDAP
ncbi:ROK family protein [Oryzobacter telluris]|uniref:ROK family protein n=1 Tax=Oryzobacter telluris TaxID=3149179 RepID=UPI00370DA0F3